MSTSSAGGGWQREPQGTGSNAGGRGPDRDPDRRAALEGPRAPRRPNGLAEGRAGRSLRHAEWILRAARVRDQPSDGLSRGRRRRAPTRSFRGHPARAGWGVEASPTPDDGTLLTRGWRGLHVWPPARLLDRVRDRVISLPGRATRGDRR